MRRVKFLAGVSLWGRFMTLCSKHAHLQWHAGLVLEDETKKDSCNTNMLHSYRHIMYIIISIFEVPIYRDQTCGLYNKMYSIKEIIVL